MLQNITPTSGTSESVVIISDIFIPKLGADIFDQTLNDLCFKKTANIKKITLIVHFHCKSLKKARTTHILGFEFIFTSGADLDLLSHISRTLARETENHSCTLARVEKCEKSATLHVTKESIFIG